MKSEQQIYALFARFDSHLVVHSVTPLLAGLSNDNYLIRTQHGAYLVKHYRDHWPQVGLAAQAHFAKRGCCPALLWHEQATQVAIFEYIEGQIISGAFTQQLLIHLVTIHRHTVKTRMMDIGYELEYYRSTAHYRQYQQLITSALNYIAEQPIDIGFCHNDLVRENIIVNAQGMFLIDFEYAKSNDVYFDLAALAVSFQLTDDKKHTLLNQYRDLLPAEQSFHYSVKKLLAYQLVFLLLCICWYEQRGVSEKVIPLQAQLDHLTISWAT
ncbi:phosphotransferase [Pseudoalteromonas mariniglutinosa]|uniref:phosphotransferase n=1 Tax=Pseudoalteromonas mariniglutinosa TaxID=206042 RepID=UPI003851049B